MGKTNGYGNSAVFRRPTGPGYDADAAAYFAAVTTPFSTARKAIINTLVTTLKADGNWAGLDRLWLMANEASDQGLISLVNPASTAMTLVNAPTFTVDQGFTGDGATSYINSNYNPNTQGVNYTLNSASVGAYARINQDAATVLLGVQRTTATAGYIYLRPRTTNTFASYINGVGVASPANTSSQGLMSMIRTASNLSNFYRNGVSLGTNAQVSSVIPNYNMYILANNLNNSSTNGYSTNQVSCVFIGSGAINQLSIYNRIQNYMTSLGTQV